MGSAGSQAGVHRLSMTHVWDAAKFDDACTVPTPCLLLSALCDITLAISKGLELRVKGQIRPFPFNPVAA